MVSAIWVWLVTDIVQVEGKEMDVEIQGETKAEGEVGLAGSIQQGKQQVVKIYCQAWSEDSLPLGQRLCRAGPGEEGRGRDQAAPPFCRRRQEEEKLQQRLRVNNCRDLMSSRSNSYLLPADQYLWFLLFVQNQTESLIETRRCVRPYFD